MNLQIPGLGDAMARLDATEEKMTEMADHLSEVTVLLREQNTLLQKLVDAL